MELRQLRYFLTVAEELHRGRAWAHRAAGIEPADQATRARAGCAGIRSSRRVQLTEPGRILVDLAGGILDQADGAIALVRQAGHGKRVGSGRLTPIRPRRAGHRRRSVRSRASEGRLTCVRAVRRRAPEGAIDAASLWMPLGDFDDLACLRVATEPLVVAVAERNRLARLAEVAVEEVAAEPLVWFARHWSPGTWDTVTSVFFSHGYSPKVIAEEVSQEGMVRGVLAAPASPSSRASMARQLSVEGVVYRPFVEPTPRVGVGLAWRADDGSVEVAEHFAETSPK